MKSKKLKLKTYVAMAVYLRHVPNKHVADNGSRQFTIVCQAFSQQKVADLVGVQVNGLRHMGIMVTDNESHIVVCQKPNTVYYCMENHNPAGMEDFRKWFEYVQPDLT